MAAAPSPFMNPDIWKTGQATLAGPGQSAGGPLQPGQPPAGPGSSTLPASFGGPVQPGAVPPSGENPHVVYTDQSGKGYNPNELASAWNSDSAFRGDAANARVGDILQQYGTVLGTPMAPTGAPAAPAGGGMAGMGAGLGAVGASLAGPSDPRASAFYDMLMSRLGGINENPGADDPIIKKQTDNYAANAERASRSYLTAAAERGGSTANTDAAARSLAEKAGQATAGFGAQLAGDERNQRRQQIQQILSTGAQFLPQQQQMALQQELHNLDLQQRAYEFDSNDSYRYSPFAPGVVS